MKIRFQIHSYVLFLAATRCRFEAIGMKVGGGGEEVRSHDRIGRMASVDRNQL